MSEDEGYCLICWRPIERDEYGLWSHVLPRPLRDPAATGYMLGLFALATAGHDPRPIRVAAALARFQRLRP